MGKSFNSSKGKTHSSSPRVSHQRRSNQVWLDHMIDDYDDDYDSYSVPYRISEEIAKQTERDKALCRNTGTIAGECCICCESDRGVYRFFKNCKHALACVRCLYTLYNPSSIVVDDYPRKCYGEYCSRILTLEDLKAANIIRTVDDALNFEDMMRMSKCRRVNKVAFRCEGLDCDFVIIATCRKAIGDMRDHDRIWIKCRACRRDQKVPQNARRLTELDPDLKLALREFLLDSRPTDKDSMGYFFGLCICPKCGILISKGDGCPMMTCTACKHPFVYDDAELSSAEIKALCEDG